MSPLRPTDFVTKESVFTELMSHDIHRMWQQRQEHTFNGVNGIPLFGISLCQSEAPLLPQNRYCVVIVNGRNESVWKYQEVMFEYFAHGFDIYTYDHRGQGASGRLADDPELGHVDTFADYVADLDTFIKTIVQPNRYSRCFLLAHSMGGAVSTLYMEQHPNIFNAAVLNAPMFGIHISSPLRFVAPAVAKLYDLYQSKPDYGLGQKAYHELPFEQNDQCQSQLRYVWAKHLYQTHPELRVGGPSARWIWQAMRAAKQCIQESKNLKTPLLLLQAGNDTIVDNRAHHLFNGNTEQCQLKVIESARHELLMEKDELRDQVMGETLSFFEQFFIKECA
ncbi:alpha/beta fold hydrolase [Photobacterium rosenbergii]|nr:alpha/beta fold hydrolase [Photobacterium rosenbergii]